MATAEERQAALDRIEFELERLRSDAILVNLWRLVPGIDKTLERIRFRDSEIEAAALRTVSDNDNLDSRQATLEEIIASLDKARARAEVRGLPLLAHLIEMALVEAHERLTDH